MVATFDLLILIDYFVAGLGGRVSPVAARLYKDTVAAGQLVGRKCTVVEIAFGLPIGGQSRLHCLWGGG